MTINIPYKVRAALYILTAVGTPVMLYLFAKGFVGELELTLWSAEITAVSALAAFNTTPTAGRN